MSHLSGFLKEGCIEIDTFTISHVIVVRRKKQRSELLLFLLMIQQFKDFPGSSPGKESACYTGDPGSIPGL